MEFRLVLFRSLDIHDESSASLEDRLAVLPEEFVVDIELRVNIGRMQDGEVVRAPGPDGPPLREVRRACGVPQRAHSEGSGAEAYAETSDIPDELSSRASVHLASWRVWLAASILRHAPRRFADSRTGAAVHRRAQREHRAIDRCQRAQQIDTAKRAQHAREAVTRQVNHGEKQDVERV